jgi:hypothetical protein
LTLRLQDASEHVQETLGLSPPDAATYVQLCLAGASKVSDLASALGLHRNDIYRSLDRLAGRGLVDTTLERPARYLARDPLRAFEQELADQLAEVEAMRQEREATMDLLRALAAPTHAPTRPSYEIIQGRQQISAARRRMLAEAQHEILLMTTSPHDILLAEFDGFADALAARAKDGGPPMRALMTLPEDLRARSAEILAYPSLEIRHLSDARLVRLLMTDSRELLLNVLNDQGHALHAPEEVALLTTAPGLLEAERIFFEHAWGGGARVRTPRAGSAL